MVPGASNEVGLGSGTWLKNPLAKIRAPRRGSAPNVQHDPAGQHAEVDDIDDDAGAAPPRRLPASRLNGQQGGSGSATPLDVGGSPVIQAQDQSVEVEDHIDEEVKGTPSEQGKEVPDVIKFYAPGDAYYWLTNGAPYEVYLDGVRYPTAEHAFQSLKFLPQREDIARKVRKAPTAMEAKRVARKHTADVQRGWRRDGLNLVAMRRVMLLKFSQHTELRKALLSTGSAKLVLTAPADVFWGNGGGRGRNEFGKALASVRKCLRTIDRLGVGSAAITV